MTNQTLRILTGLVGIPAVVALIYLGGWPFAAAVVVAGLITQGEFYALVGASELRPYQGYGLVWGTFVLLQPMLDALVGLEGVLLAGLLLLVLAMPFLRDDRPLENFGTTVLGLLYPTFLFSFLIRLRLAGESGMVDGFWLTLLLFLLIWSADTFAYFAGRRFGRRPLFPRVSPKKTWEGAIGGLVGAIVMGIVVVSVADTGLRPGDGAALAAIAGVAGPLGDLAESRLKRSVGVKDSGHILPGHGGLLDRFDALLVAAPLFWAYAVLLLQ